MSRSSSGSVFGASVGGSGPFGSGGRVAWRRAIGRHRRALAALSAGLAVLAVLVAVRPEVTPTGPVVVAARDLAAGSTPGRADVLVVDIPTTLRPAGVLRAVGQVEGVALTGPLRRGEPVTDVRVARPGATPDAGTVALPTRFADADAVAVLRPGDRIDVLAAPSSEYPGPARLIAADALVLTRPPGGATAGAGALLMLEVPRTVAPELAGVATGSALTYTIHRLVNGAVAEDRE
jgi:Flp pilus assembly protein CpaB